MNPRFPAIIASLAFAITLHAQNTSPFWSLAGNSNANSAAKLGTTTADPLNLTTNNLTRLTILPTGQSGFGANVTTANATRVLNLVDGNAVMRILRVHPTNAPAIELLSRTSSDGANVAYWDAYAEPTDASFRIRDRVTGVNLDRFTINGSGNVGIGTTSPTRKLHVAGTGYFSGNTTIDGSLGVRGPIDNDFALTVNSVTSSGIRINDPVDNVAVFSSKSGIGYALNIVKTSASSTTAAIRGAGLGSADGVFAGSSSGFGLSAYSESSRGIYAVSNSTPAQGGYAGYFVGNQYRGIYVQGGGGYYAGYFNGDVFTTGNYQSSDSRFKKNILDVEGAIGIIKQLQPKHYEFRKDGDFAKLNLPKGDHYGLLAQDVEKVLPHIVKDASTNTRDLQAGKAASENESEEMQRRRAGETVAFKAVNYTELIPILVKAVQEQQAVIEELQAKLSRLENGKTVTHNAGASLGQSTPNPARSSTRISYRISTLR